MLTRKFSCIGKRQAAKAAFFATAVFSKADKISVAGYAAKNSGLEKELTGKMVRLKLNSYYFFSITAIVIRLRQTNSSASFVIRISQTCVVLPRCCAVALPVT